MPLVPSPLRARLFFSILFHENGTQWPPSQSILCPPGGGRELRAGFPELHPENCRGSFMETPALVGGRGGRGTSSGRVQAGAAVFRGGRPPAPRVLNAAQVRAAAAIARAPRTWLRVPEASGSGPGVPRRRGSVCACPRARKTSHPLPPRSSGRQGAACPSLASFCQHSAAPALRARYSTQRHPHGSPAPPPQGLWAPSPRSRSRSRHSPLPRAQPQTFPALSPAL